MSWTRQFQLQKAIYPSLASTRWSLKGARDGPEFPILRLLLLGDLLSRQRSALQCLLVRTGFAGRSQGFLLKRSAKTNGRSRRWFVLNEKTGKLGYTKKREERHFRGVINLEECNIEEIPDDSAEEPPAKSSKNKKKENGPDSGKDPSLVFKITSKVQYKTVLKAHSAVALKAENMADKVEWDNKFRDVTEPSKGAAKGNSLSETGLPIRQSFLWITCKWADKVEWDNKFRDVTEPSKGAAKGNSLSETGYNG